VNGAHVWVTADGRSYKRVVKDEETPG
jgi:hypothetical protein